MTVTTDRPSRTRAVLDELAASAPEVPELVGIIEIATLTGVKVDTVYRWRQRRVLPEPLQTVSSTPVWARSTIDAWARATNRLP